MVSLFNDGNTAVYFGSFGIEYIPQKVLSKIKGKSITHDIFIFRIQDDDRIICRFYCIALIEYMLAEKTLLDYIPIYFPPDEYKENEKIIYKCFKDNNQRKRKP